MISRRKFILSTSIGISPLLLPNAAMSSTSSALPLDAYQNKVIMVDFWASWCIPCKRSFPWLNSVHTKYQDHGLAVVGVNVDEEQQDAKRFLSENPANFPIIYDTDGKYAKHYALKAMPSSLVFDRDGVLIAQHHGFKSEEIPKYEAILNSALRNS